MSIPNNSNVQSPIPSVPLQAGHAQDLSAPFVKSDKRGGTFQSNENFTVLALKVGSFMTDFKEIFAAGVAIATYIFLDFYAKDIKKIFFTSLALAEISIFLGSELQKKPLVNLESDKALALVPTGLLKA